MVKTLPQKHSFSIGDTDVVSVDFTKRLDASEVIDSAAVVGVDDDSELSIGSVQVNSAAYDDELQPDARGNAATVAIGKAVQFTLSSSATLETEYTIKVTATSDRSPARVLVRHLKLVFK